MRFSRNNHPPGLLALSGTEIWERFSYYTTRAVLVLYARDVIFVPIDDEGEKENFVWFAQSFAKLHGVDLRHTSDISEEARRARVDAISSKLYGTYTAFVYLTPVLGLSLIHISEPTRRRGISYAVFCLKKKN